MKRFLTIGVLCRPFLHPLLATCLVLSVGWLALAAEGPTSVVVVPPVVGGDEESRQAAAAMLSDRLAASLSAMANTEVVDRTQIDRVLRERATSDGDHGPIISFNLILRVREDVRPIRPALVVELIDLSLGNVTGSWRLENWDGAVTDTQVEQASAPSQAPSSLILLRCAISITDRASGASTSVALPLASMKVILGISPTPGKSTKQ